MTLKIILKPINDTPPFVNIGSNAQVIDIESGVDISKCIRDIDIKIHMDEWVTATLECDIGELELIGVEAERIFPIEIREEPKKKLYTYRDGKNIKRKMIKGENL